MRPDFNKLLVERERAGHNKCYGDTRNNKRLNASDVLQIGGKEGMRRRHKLSGEDKSFNENLNPLKGFLRGKVGKKWDKTYSELRKTFDARSAINNHILQHLYQYVEMNAVVIDGRVMVLKPYGDTGYVPIKQSYSDYYVCPKDGILKKTSKQPRRSVIKEQEAAKQREVDKVLRIVDGKTHLRLMDGLWYAFDVLELPPAKIEYRRPGGEDKYRVSGYGSGAKFSTWAELSEPLKRRYGVKTAVEGVVIDEFTGQEVYREASGRGYYSTRRYGVYTYGPNTLGRAQYYANKRTASHKILKALGIDGTAIFDEDVGAMSHREASKYRKVA